MPSTNDSADEPESHDVRCVVTFDPTDGRPSEAVVTAVAAVLEADPDELSPLYDAVDPGALNDLVEHAQRAAADGTHLVWFTYEGFDVGVSSDGRIRIRNATAAS